MLKYPHDRIDGHVMLSGPNGLFLPDFSRDHNRGSDVGNALKYCGIFLRLANRLSKGEL